MCESYIGKPIGTRAVFVTQCVALTVGHSQCIVAPFMGPPPTAPLTHHPLEFGATAKHCVFCVYVDVSNSHIKLVMATVAAATLGRLAQDPA